MRTCLRHRFHLLFIAVLLAGASILHAAQSLPPAPSSSAKQIFVPSGTEAAYDAVHYAPVVRVGNMVIVSGVASVGPGEFEDQLRRMFDRIKDNLAAAGATLDDVVELQSFHRGGPDSAAFQAEFRRVRAIHDEYFKQNYPAWTAVGNAVLLAPNALVEMRVMAIAGSGRDAAVHRAPAPPRLDAPPATGPRPIARPNPETLAPKTIDLTGRATVPARFIFGNRPMIDVTINGHGPYHLSIETGGPYALALTPKVVAELGLQPSTGPLPMWNIDALQIGSMTLRDLKARPSVGEQPFPGADGLLGLAAYRDLLLTIDYPGARVTFERGALPTPNGEDVFALSPVGPLLAVPASLGGRPTSLVVDTQSGGSAVMCNPAIAEQLPFAAPPVTVGQAVVSGLAADPVPLGQARLAGAAAVGQYSIDQPFVDIMPMPGALAALGDMCTMGADFLAHFSMTLDERSGRMRLAASRHAFPKPDSIRTLGVSFVASSSSPGGIRVAAVQAGGPAARAGLLVNDEVIAIDGRAPTAESTSSYALRELARRSPGIKLRVARQGKTVDARVAPDVLIR